MGQDHSHMVIDNLLYSCVDKAQRSNEQFVPEHTLGYIIAGETHFMHSAGVQVYGAGTIGLVKRNQLIKSVKVPPPGGEFKAINIFFSQEILRKYSAEPAKDGAVGKELAKEGDQGIGGAAAGSFLILSPDPFLTGYFDSLLPYFTDPGKMNAALTELKTIEAIELVLSRRAGLKELLFDFSEPYKIDLEAFMEQHYMYNVSMSDFARLTGRSLASFKRDFEKIFDTSPGQWLQQKRLREAYYLIKEKGVKPSVAYLDVGFENLSHFSTSFKKAFGVAPSLV